MAEKKIYKKRAFLNPQEGVAACDAHVTINEEEKYIEVDAYLGISDCSNMVTLDFSTWHSSSMKKRLRERRQKIKRFRETINGFLDALEVAYDELEEKAPEKAKAKKDG